MLPRELKSLIERFKQMYPGYVWDVDTGWTPPAMASYAAVGHGG